MYRFGKKVLVAHKYKDEVLTAIDYGKFSGCSRGRYWAVDPIDGTKGFLRGEQYAVAIGLIENGKVVVGVLGCPNLTLDFSAGRQLSNNQSIIATNGAIHEAVPAAVKKSVASG